MRDVKQAESIRNMTANAREETVFTQVAFREAIRRWRCLVPSTGFYEYHHSDDGAAPFRIYLQEMEIFSLAGVFNEWVNPASRIPC